ncbi:MAG: hypothetical protein AAFY35_03080 [Pseudomonadota bacterium]
MPGISFDEPLFSANASAATDWGSIQGSALVQMPVDLQLNRGASFQLGLMGHLRGEAQFQRFIAAQVTGQIGAQARVQGQIQMPMNLFRETGFAVRLQAILEAAAGVEAGLGISVGDFIDLAQSQLQLRGLPLQLFMIFMEEVDIGATFSAKAAFTAQAYANLVCTGRFVGDATNDPGLQFAFGYGYGWKGGYGMRVAARAGFKDVSRLVARSADVIVDKTVDTLLENLTEDQQTERAILNASRPVAKIAVRVAYETGEYMVENDLPFDANGAQKAALRVVQVILEEGQRGLLREIMDDALAEFNTWLENQITQIDGGTFAALRPEREALAAHLRSMPREAFDLRDSSAMEYWNTLSILMVNTAVAFTQQTTPLTPSEARTIAQVWAATQLLFAATKRVTRADASVSVIGLPPAEAKASFEGALPSQPHPRLRDAIADIVQSATGTAPGSDLTQEDLLVFLMEGGALAALTANNPTVTAFLEPFVGSGLGATKSDIARLLMTSMGSVMTNAAGELDAQLSLQELAEGLRLFTHDKFEQIAVPAAHAALPAHQAEARMFLDEVLLPSMRMVIDTGFTDILGWANGTVDQTALEEALSSVLMAIFGRSVIVTGDILMAFTQENFSDLLDRLAAEPGTPDDPQAMVQLPAGFCEAAGQILNPALPLTAEQIAEELRVFLSIGAEVAKPFPPEVRARMRQLMFDVIAPIPATGSEDFLEELKDDLWIPNDASLMALGDEMMGQVGEQLSEFVTRLLAHAADVIRDGLDDALNASVSAVRSFISALSEALALVAARLVELAGEIAETLQDLAELAADMADRLQDLTEGMAERVVDFVDALAGQMMPSTRPILIGTLAYNTVPSGYRPSVQSLLRQTLARGIDQTLAPLLNAALATLAQETESITDELLNLPQGTSIQDGLRLVFLDRLRASLPLHDMTIPIAFTFHWSVTVPVFAPSLTNPPGQFVNRTISHSARFDLGNVSVPLGAVYDLLEDTLLSGDAVEDAIEALVETVRAHLEAALYLTDLTEEQSRLSSSQDELAAQNDAMSHSVSRLRILAPELVAQNPVHLQFEIEGVTSEFATPNAQLPDRIVVFLNDERVPLSAFAVSGQNRRGRGGTRTRGIALTLKEPMTLADGINTLTVSVVDGKGVETRQTHAFIVDAPELTRPKLPERPPGKVPSKPKRLPSKKPAKDHPVEADPVLIPWRDAPNCGTPPRRAALGFGTSQRLHIARVAKAQVQVSVPDPIAGVARYSNRIAERASKGSEDRPAPDAPHATVKKTSKSARPKGKGGAS